MAFTINSIQSSVALTRPGSQKSGGSPFQNKLGVSGDAATSSASSSVNVDQLAQRNTALKLSSGLSTIDSRQAFTQRQQVTVEALIAKAQEIKREADPQRRTSLATDAAALIASDATETADAVRDDANVDDNVRVFATIDSSVDPGNSSREFSTTISGISSLASLGVSGSLSFSSANIDNTITTLEAARSSLEQKQASFESSRSDIASEISVRSSQADLRNSSSGQSIEDVASALAAKITSSAQGLLANKGVEKLDVSRLLADVEDESDDDESSSLSSSNESES